MKTIRIYLNFSALLLVSGFGSASGQNLNTSSYQYLTIYENCVFGNVISFWSADTLDGPVHSNDTLSITQSPVFADTFSTSANLFNSIGGDPVFLLPPIFNAPRVALPQQAEGLRLAALEAGLFFSDNYGQLAHRLVFDDLNGWILYGWLISQPFADSIIATGPPLANEVIWVDGYLELKGVFSGRGTVGARGRLGVGGPNCIRLIDDIRYSFANPINGDFNDTTGGYLDMLGIVCEGHIAVGNTWENGRENRTAGQDIVITAALTALGESFTFEDQNDNYIWEFSTGYISPTWDDNRGTIHLHGSIAQYRRGYVHRNNHGRTGGPPGDTGYSKHYVFDQRFSADSPPGILARHVPLLEPAELDFGDLSIGTTDTLTVALGNAGGTFIDVDTLRTNNASFLVLPVDSLTLEPGDSTTFQVIFSPLEPGVQRDTLLVELYFGTDLQVPLSGNGVALGIPLSSTRLPNEGIAIYPNPFNEQIRISFNLPDNPVNLTLYNLIGQPVLTTPLSGNLGTGTFTWRTEDLPSGIYWITLKTTQRLYTQKIVHIK